MNRLRTGDVAQLRQYGRNYVILGKSITTEGEPQVILMKNGSINSDGTLRKFPRNKRPYVFVAKPERITRVHGRRSVDLDNIRTKVPNLSQVLVRMDGSNGVISMAPHIAGIVQTVTDLNDN